MSLHTVILVIIYCITSISAVGPIVKTSQGILEGKFWKSRQGREFKAFLSIPFAEPPVGPLRFQPPVPPQPWKGTRDATKNHALCPQRNIYTRSDIIEGDEDCLYLNIYTPKLPDETSQLLPVMVFIHGGGWLCCAGNFIYYGPDVLLDRDVVLVVPNYRLGPLGFLSTGDLVVPGNNGLKDQSLALRWIKENIKHFGGDPHNIVVFGESAGGASTHFHMMSPLSKDLISGGISQSGTAFTSWSLSQNEETQTNSRKLARSFGCPDDDSEKMVECLRKIDAHEIIAKDRMFMVWDTDPMIPFKPVVEPAHEGAFLPEHPMEIIRSGKMAKVPWIAGINDGDGALRSAAIFGNPEVLEDFKSKLDYVLPYSLEYYHIAPDPNAVTKRIKDFYFENGEIDENVRMNVTNMFTDAWFLEGTDRAVQAHLKYTNTPVYLYLFGYRGSASYTEIFGDPNRDYGACHADELQYLFPVGDELFPDKKPNEEDTKMAYIMTNLWVNFANTGNPTATLKETFLEDWRPVESKDQLEYYEIKNPRSLRMRKGLYQQRVEFWRNLSPYSQTGNSSRYRDEL